MEQIPHHAIPVIDEGKRMFRQWRLYFANKDNQLQSNKAWTPTAGLADGAISSTTVEVSGAALTDTAIATHDQIGARDVMISAHVQEAGIVRVILENKTGAPVTVAAGTVYVTVFRRQ